MKVLGLGLRLWDVGFRGLGLGFLYGVSKGSRGV